MFGRPQTAEEMLAAFLEQSRPGGQMNYQTGERTPWGGLAGGLMGQGFGKDMIYDQLGGMAGAINPYGGIGANLAAMAQASKSAKKQGLAGEAERILRGEQQARDDYLWELELKKLKEEQAEKEQEKIRQTAMLDFDDLARSVEDESATPEDWDEMVRKDTRIDDDLKAQLYDQGQAMRLIQEGKNQSSRDLEARRQEALSIAGIMGVDTSKWYDDDELGIKGEFSGLSPDVEMSLIESRITRAGDAAKKAKELSDKELAEKEAGFSAMGNIIESSEPWDLWKSYQGAHSDEQKKAVAASANIGKAVKVVKSVSQGEGMPPRPVEVTEYLMPPNWKESFESLVPENVKTYYRYQTDMAKAMATGGDIEAVRKEWLDQDLGGDPNALKSLNASMVLKEQLPSMVDAAVQKKVAAGEDLSLAEQILEAKEVAAQALGITTPPALRSETDNDRIRKKLEEILKDHPEFGALFSKSQETRLAPHLFGSMSDKGLGGMLIPDLRLISQTNVGRPRRAGGL